MNATILLVEDNEQNRYLMTYLLEHSGCTVTPAPDGPAGLALAARQRFDLILLDIQLPGMDGYAVARALRADVSQADVPIIAVTSHAMAGDREQALLSGCTAYLEKPINPATFVDEVERILRSAGKVEGS